MSVLFVVLPIALVLAGLGVAAFVWMTRSGQLDDLETPAWRVVFDERGVGELDRGPRGGDTPAPLDCGVEQSGSSSGS